MSQFFTLDGTRFYNKDAFKVLEVITKDKTIDGKFYLYFTVSDDNENIIYTSNDYKISEDGYNTSNGTDMFQQQFDNIIECLSKI